VRLRKLGCAAGQHPSLGANFGSRPRGCKDFIERGCVVGGHGDEPPVMLAHEL
jgi:hypothetical protein